MAISRNIGERSTGVGSSATNRGKEQTVDVGYSANNVVLTDIGTENKTMAKQTPLGKLTPLYGGAGPSSK